MPRYEITTDQGRFEVETDQPIADGKAGQEQLQRLLTEDLYQRERREAVNWTPTTRAIRAVTRLWPPIANAINSVASPDPPGGPRRPLLDPTPPDAMAISKRLDYQLATMGGLLPPWYIYDLDLENGETVRLTTDQPVADGEQGRQQLQQLLAEKQAQEAAQQVQREAWKAQMGERIAEGVTRGTPTPTEASAWSNLGTQALGGVRDFVQDMVDTPLSVVNTITPFLSPDPPGGPRRQLVPQLQYDIPGPPPPETSPEWVARNIMRFAPELAAVLFSPPLGGLRRRLGASTARTVDEVPLTFGPQGAMWRGVPAGQKPIKTMAEVPLSLDRISPLSEGAQNVARLLNLPDSVESISRMSMNEAAQARNILLRLADKDPLTLREGPLGELFERIETQLLRYR